MKRSNRLFEIVNKVVLSAAILILSGCSSDTKTITEMPAATISNDYAVLPTEIEEFKQLDADIFSWKSFIALNWPANTSTCSADTTNGVSILSGKGPVVWETYLTNDQVFVSPTSHPHPWCSSSMELIPEKVLMLSRETGVKRFLHSTAKSPHSLNQASGGPLVDQNGRFARYEVRMNEDEYNYITKNGLWNKAGQQAFVAKDSVVNMPIGKTIYGDNGAMELKAAWKIMGKGDDPSRFYTIKAIVYNDDTGEPSPGENPVTLGLVGLHIMHKVVNQNNWVWSTFEQVDNLTTSFFNAACDTCPVNKPLPSGEHKELSPDRQPLNPPTQVTRINAIENPDVDSLNLAYQELLSGSVWSNYKLVSTQWLLFENMTPLYLANTVQETFLQGPNPPSYGGYHLNIDQPYYADSLYKPFSSEVSSSCMACHYVATLPISGVDAKADFSFILGDAQ